LDIRLPLTMFEKGVLRKLNIAPAQLHPNSWVFVKSFKITCKALGIVPTLGKVFYFF